MRQTGQAGQGGAQTCAEAGERELPKKNLKKKKVVGWPHPVVTSAALSA